MNRKIREVSVRTRRQYESSEGMRDPQFLYFAAVNERGGWSRRDEGREE